MKSTQKVARVSIKRRSAPKKSALSIVIKDKSTPVAKKVAVNKLDSKLEVVSKTPTKKLKNDKSYKISEPSFLAKSAAILKPQVALAVISRYLLPVDGQKFAVGVARFSGVFFVVIGALFTLFFASNSFSNVTSQLASLESATTSTSTSRGTSNAQVNCADPLQYVSTTCSSLVNHTPQALFDVQGNRNALSGSVRVRIGVSFAKSVTLILYNPSLNQYVPVGQMSPMSPNNWEININTTSASDGMYKLRARVENGYGVYEVADGSLVTIINFPLEIPVSSTSTPHTNTNVSTSTTHASTTAQPLVSPSETPLLKANNRESNTGFQFEIQTQNADSVQIYALEKATQKNIFVGSAYKDSASTWKYNWNITSYADGAYEVLAQVVKSVNSFNSNVITVTKKVTVTQPLQNAATASSTVTPLVMNPKVSIDIQANTPLTGVAGLKIDVKDATSIEVFSLRKSELTKHFLGAAKKVNDSTWIYMVDTDQLPNSEYSFVVAVLNSYGLYEEKTGFVKVTHPAIPYTKAQQDAVTVLEKVAQEIQVNSVPLSQSIAKTVSATSTVGGDKNRQKINDEALFKTVQSQIDSELNVLTKAIRMGDPKEVELVKQRLQEIQSNVVVSDEQKKMFGDLNKKVDAYVADAVLKVEEKVVLTNKIISERTKEQANKDSDKDGISDYDEITLFKTNPFNADTDGDGYPDGVEILNGTDPNNAKQEALVTYESPKDAGIIRDDILKVVSIATVIDTSNDKQVKKIPSAIISGKALPNSFVTLYIFSTPIVVTIKTDADGSWAYRFDKELENGTHEVFVGITDNAGKIVAKSNSFSFVKEAQAFGPASNPNIHVVTTQVDQKPTTFLSQYMVYLVLSISVVAIGLVLILLGLHLNTRTQREKEDELDHLQTV